MSRFLFSVLLVLLTAQTSFSQSQNIKDAYFDFLQIRTEPYKAEESIKKGLELLQRSKELSMKQIASVTYHLGRLYEANEDMASAIPYYEKSIKLSPDYYVPYRALGFWYFKDAVDLGIKLSRIDKVKEPALYAELSADYKKLALKTTAYLEKSQACDPDDETLSMIVDLYNGIGDTDALSNLPKRLKLLEKNCVTLLDDE
ncbi:hypothetical protein EZJ43_15060 [Pedobacter changchengzhani]|uniref:Uncharacterized protein n=1 Tax=Pedobacter changchengzhani TaxID=2529274 RepID=A0A4R5MJ63_9SPHI|nr:tetratricopeptide repeat protein [Pedobacter changchengzhani]TDG35215.1 hypothetical protein EZJ43_15060 [Pedobacter changchengzhani]